MAYPEENELRCIRVDGLPPMTEAIYLYSCFHDNTEVLAATVLRHWPTEASLDYGFVEFPSHEEADFALKFYNGQRMPNFNHERFCLSWDTADLATMWRWDYFYRLCSFFGYDETGDVIDANSVIEESPPCERPYLPSANQLNGLSPAGCIETGFDNMSLAHPNMYQQGYAHPSLRFQQNQPHLMQWVGGCGAAYVNQLPYQQLQTQLVGGHGAAYVNQLPYQQLLTQSVGGHGAAYVNQLPYQQLLTHLVGGHGASYVNQPPYQQLKQQRNVGSDVRTLGKLTQVRKIGPLMKKEKELYLCFEEFNFGTSVYVIRTIKLSELLSCSCGFDTNTYTISKCHHCASKTKQESQLYQRAWIFSGPTYVCKEQRIPKGMACVAYGSQMFFAGGVVPPRDAPPPEGFIPSGDVYCFEPESTVWRKLDFSFLKGKPAPLLFEVNENLYCLSVAPFGISGEPPTFEVYNSRSRECFILPVPQVDWQGLKDGCSLITYLSNPELPCAVVGTKILISTGVGMLVSPCIPIVYFDVNDKERKWRVMRSLFDGEPFPFDGRALVLDSNGAQVMFSFRRKSMIYVSRLAVDDVTGDISISDDKCMDIYVRALMKMVSPLSHTFVDLGDQNVAFVLCGNITSVKKREYCMGKVRGVVVVMHYEVSGSEHVTSEILATRTFEYDCRSPHVSRTDLICGLVA